MLKFKSPLVAAVAALALAAPMAQAAPASLLSEGFDNINTLDASGWAATNFSSPEGTTSWFQGDAGIFGAQAGVGAESYIAANYNSAVDGGMIENWLVTPELFVKGGGLNAFSFFTRTQAADFADRLLVLYSPTGVLNTGSFTEVLADINGQELQGGFPADWTQFSFQLSPSGAAGRVAFVYLSSNSNNANYIGIDTVKYDVPEPESFGLVALALGGLLVSRRRKTVAA